MSVSKMEKLTAILPIGEADKLLRRLMRLRCVSLNKTEATEDMPLSPIVDSEAATQAAASAARADAVLPVLRKHTHRKKQLFAPITRCDFNEFKASGDADRAKKTVEETERILQADKELDQKLAAEEALMQSLLPYLAFPFSLSDSGTANARLLLGSIPAGIKPHILEETANEAGFVLEILSADKTGTYVSLLFHRKEEEKTLRALSPFGFLPAAFADTNGKPTAIFDAAAKRAETYKKDKERLKAQLEILAENLTDVEILSDVEHTEMLTEDHKKKLGATKKCSVLTGWCPIQEKERVIKAFEQSGAAFDFAPPEEGDDVPVLLKNNGFAQNFEWIVGMYSYPQYGKFDPTFIMSIFYFLIFGLMFADAGYGLLLTLAGFLIPRKFDLRDGMRRFMLMFGYCGISCIIFGVLFGSYFGNFPLAFMEYMLGYTGEQLPNLALTPTLAANVAVWFDPLQSPMTFLVLSLGVGALHLLVGMAVKAYILCRSGKVLDALFDIGSYWLLFAGIACLFLTDKTGIILTVCGVLAIIATQGRQKKGVFGKLIGGFGGIYNLINYASDLLSYSRILALGLASAVIGQVVNVVATMKGASFIGFILMIVVFLIGHALNLVINVLGTFVHTARLQYIEFFGRFYEDGGTPFRPITAAEKYTEDVTATPEQNEIT